MISTKILGYGSQAPPNPKVKMHAKGIHGGEVQDTTTARLHTHTKPIK